MTKMNYITCADFMKTATDLPYNEMCATEVDILKASEQSIYITEFMRAVYRWFEVEE